MLPVWWLWWTKFVYLNKRQPLHSMLRSTCVPSTNFKVFREENNCILVDYHLCIKKKSKTNRTQTKNVKCPNQFPYPPPPTKKRIQNYWGLKMQGICNYMWLDSNFTGWQKYLCCRNVKPSNILVTGDPSFMLSDFSTETLMSDELKWKIRVEEGKHLFCYFFFPTVFL